jgi:beta-lactamase regulating signal transducer with metallopeptidase domain
MSLAAQSAQLFLLAGIAFLAFGALVATAFVRIGGARLSRWEPRARHRAIAMLAALPAASAVVLLFAATLPSLVALVAPALDHCPVHDDGHAHLCFVHLPKVGIHTGLLLCLVFLVSYAALRAVFAASSVVRAVRVVAALARTGEQRRDLGITIVETSQPVCFAAGLLRPRVLLSRGLFNALSPEERAVVLAHERAHVRRRDALVGSVVRALAVVHLPWVGRWLVHELEVAAEQACDEEAARFVTDRVSVAAAILMVERAAQHAAARELAPVAVAFGARAVERRVEALLGEPEPPRSLRPLAISIGVGLVSVLVLADELHHLTESVLSVIAH